MPETVEECVRHTMDDENVTESQAYAICWARFNSGKIDDDEDYEWSPETDEEDIDEEEQDDTEKIASRARRYYNRSGELDKESSLAVALAVTACEKAGVEDGDAAASVAHKVATGEWPGYHPAEKTLQGRNHLRETYKYVVKKIFGKQEVAKTLSKSDTMEKLDFTAEFAGTQTVFKADDDFVIWGPASVEVVDKEGDRIKAEALDDALPQLLKRARLSLDHSDQLVGEIIESYELDKEVEIEIGDKTYKREEFPTDVLDLEGQEPSLFVCGRIYDDTRQSKRVREAIEEGELNSYSISGEALVSRSKIEDGEPVNDIVDIDLSAVTVCEEGMNQKAEFSTVAKGEDGGVEKSNSLTIQTRDGNLAIAKSSDDPGQDENGRASDDRVIRIRKEVHDSNMTEEETTEKNEEAPQEVTMEELTKEFRSTVTDVLEDQDLAKEDDILQKDDVEDIVDESIEAKMDDIDGVSKEDVEEIVDEKSMDDEDVEGIVKEILEAREVEKEGEDDEEDEEDEKAEEDDEEDETEEKELTEEEVYEIVEEVVGDLDNKAEDEGPPAEDDEADEKEGDDDVPGDDEDDEQKAEGYTMEDLQEALPEDILDAVESYLGEEKEDDDDDEDDEVDKTEKSEEEEDPVMQNLDIEKTVQEEIDNRLGTASSPGAVTSEDNTEKSYEGDESETDSVNPALELWN